MFQAQGNLNNCILGNTTIFAEAPSDAEVQSLLAHLSATANNNNNNNGGTGGWARGSSALSNKDTWSSGGGGGNTSQLWGTPSNPSSGGSLWGAPPLDSVDRATPSSLNSFLPGDLLGGESM